MYDIYCAPLTCAKKGEKEGREKEKERPLKGVYIAQRGTIVANVQVTEDCRQCTHTRLIYIYIYIVHCIVRDQTIYIYILIYACACVNIFTKLYIYTYTLRKGCT